MHWFNAWKGQVPPCLSNRYQEQVTIQFHPFLLNKRPPELTFVPFNTNLLGNQSHQGVRLVLGRLEQVQVHHVAEGGERTVGLFLRFWSRLEHVWLLHVGEHVEGAAWIARCLNSWSFGFKHVRGLDLRKGAETLGVVGLVDVDDLGNVKILAAYYSLFKATCSSWP